MTTVAGTAPYPWPYDGRLVGEQLALVLAGWDVRWRARALTADVDAVEARCSDLAGAVARIGGTIVAVAHGDVGALGAPAGVSRVELGAAGTDGFFGGPLDALLRRLGHPHLVIAGHGLEGPVHSTLRSANDRGFECLLVADACSALTDDCRSASSSMICMSGGIFGAVGGTGSLLTALAALAAPAHGRTAIGAGLLTGGSR